MHYFMASMFTSHFHLFSRWDIQNLREIYIYRNKVTLDFQASILLVEETPHNPLLLTKVAFQNLVQTLNLKLNRLISCLNLWFNHSKSKMKYLENCHELNQICLLFCIYKNSRQFGTGPWIFTAETFEKGSLIASGLSRINFWESRSVKMVNCRNNVNTLFI